MVAGVFAAHGLRAGKTYSGRYESYENEDFRRHLQDVGKDWKGKAALDFIPAKGDAPKLPIDFVKCGVEYWPTVRALNPKAVIKVKRNIESAVKSVCDKRGERYADVKPLIERRYEMLDEVPGVTVNTDKLVKFDFSEIREAFKVAGIEFDESKARSAIDPDKWTF